MLIDTVRPTTLTGVRRLAGQLRKANGLKHSEALDQAARAADCSNYQHARRSLPERPSPAASHYVLLTIYWFDRNGRPAMGRETLRVELPCPIEKLCNKQALKHVRSFGDLRVVADDHLICDTVAQSQDYARDRLCSAARSLQFMVHTGLQPCSRSAKRRCLREGRTDRLPGHDHTTDWIDPATGQYIMIDEPYANVPDEEERSGWASQHGWQVVKSSWPGMYNPYACDLYVAVQGAGDVQALVTKIDRMPPPVMSNKWPGESAGSWEVFTSPLALTAQDRRRARCRGTIYPAASAKTLPYSYGFNSTRRRPAGALGIEGHQEVGRIIKAIAQSDQRPWGVYQRMNALRGELENWLHLEIGPDALQGPEFFDVYYHEIEDDLPFIKEAETREGVLSLLQRLRDRLSAAYPSCGPLRQQLGRIDSSAKLVCGMKATGVH